MGGYIYKIMDRPEPTTPQLENDKISEDISDKEEENVSIEIADISKSNINIDESFSGIPTGRNNNIHNYNHLNQTHI